MTISGSFHGNPRSRKSVREMNDRVIHLHPLYVDIMTFNVS